MRACGVVLFLLRTADAFVPRQQSLSKELRTCGARKKALVPQCHAQVIRSPLPRRQQLRPAQSNDDDDDDGGGGDEEALNEFSSDLSSGGSESGANVGSDSLVEASTTQPSSSFENQAKNTGGAANSTTPTTSTTPTASTTSTAAPTASTSTNFGLLRPFRFVGQRCVVAARRFKSEPRKHLMIPLGAAFVGWLTNWLAVEMIFYPLEFKGLALKRWPGVPLGLVGWQGIVPSKADVMAGRIVDMVTSKLVDVPVVFKKLDPAAIATLLSPEVDVMASSIATEALPRPMVRFLRRFASFGVGGLGRGGAGGGGAGMGGGNSAGLQGESAMLASLRDIQRRMLEGLTRDLQRDPSAVLDVRAMVVEALSTDKRVLVDLFRKVGSKELNFLVLSGAWVGISLGLVQMVLYMFCQQRWTLIAGGGIVGCLTNWIALKCIFEPVLPTPVSIAGKVFVLQGRFMMRQVEVATEFASYMTTHVLTSANIWSSLFNGPNQRKFRSLLDVRLRRAVAAASQVVGIDSQALPVDGICDGVWRRLPKHVDCLHPYIDGALGLGPLMAERMRVMSPKDFEGVLHPIFQEDEATLTIVGGVMGALVGFFQSGGGGKRKYTADKNKEQQPKGGAASLSSSFATRHPLPSHTDDAGEYDGYAL